MTDAAPEEVRFESADGVATITIDRPARRNALNDTVIERLRQGLARARADEAVRVVMLTGAGDRVFSAGGDLSPGAGGGGILGLHHRRGGFAELLLELRELGKPTIARVNGDALGGGFGLALACDLTVAREDARFGCPELDVGLFPMMISAILTRSVPRKVAVELMLTGRRLDAREAKALGVINDAMAPEALDTRVAELAQGLAAKSPAVMRLGLEALRHTEDMSLEESLRHLQLALSMNTLAEDAAEGVMAFLQKRPPVWKGR